MKYLFLFIFGFVVVLLLPVNFVKAETEVATKPGFCVCEKTCDPYSYLDPAKLMPILTNMATSGTATVDANATCTNAPCSSKYAFVQNAQCGVGLPMHCDCKSGCVDKTYNTMESLKIIDDACKALPCDGKEIKANACAKTPATPAAGATKKEPDVVSLDNPLKLGKTVPAILGAIIKGALGIMGGLVLLMVVWGGTTWITAAGSPEKVKAGSQTILWALLGGILTVASYVILNNIIKQFF